MGYALDSWDFITKFLVKRGFSEAQMEKAGLLIRREDGSGYFDRFRNRVMFPIHDHHCCCFLRQGSGSSLSI
ncbi:hypothetical protein [Bacillus subtilis]|uniref:hypothetical protein n=1 Tax=Bacillus subtilis TaxID=1423 RepID=UPI003306CA7D